MTATELLAEFDGVTHHERMRRMVRLGQQAKTDTGTQALLQTLRQGNVYERYLALISCSGSRDGAHVVQALTEVSRGLRGLALKLAAVVCTDAQVTDGLASLPTQEQVVLLRDLLRHKRQPAIDAFLTAFAETTPDAPDALTRLGQLLPFGSAAMVRRRLDQITPRFGRHDWARLARLHPDLAVESLQEQVRALTEADARIYHNVTAVLPFVARKEPEAALELVRQLQLVQPLSGLELVHLTERCPRETADILLKSPDSLRFVQLSRSAPDLSESQIVALLETRPATLAGHGLWLRRVRPAIRRAAHLVAGVGWRGSDGSLDTLTVSALPGDLRVNEARRCLVLPTLATRPNQRLPYAAFLPWDEARSVLATSIGSPDPDLRSVALAALIGSARYQPSYLPDVLALVRARSNEQDPVRGVLLKALADLPPSRWQAEHRDDLQQIVTDALSAADLSPATAREAERLLFRLLPFHTDWGAQEIARLAQAQGATFRLSSAPLTDHDARALAHALLPVLASWESRERESQLLQVASGFQNRLKTIPDIAPRLERIALATRSNANASTALTLLAKHFPARFALFIPKLLQSDPTTGTLYPVYQYLHRVRQDLLTPYLGRNTFAGRFQTGKTRWVLPVEDRFWRWTPRQQELWATALSEINGDTDRDIPSVLRAVARLARLPFVGPERVIARASLTETRAAVRDAALRALAHFDAGQGIPTLLDALNDKRARIAIYALRSALLEMPASEALALLRQVPTQKVTVAKEVVRLLGELATPEAFLLLHEMARQTDPPPHRDVRIALMRGLWDHLQHPETWDIFDAAASNTDTSIAGAVVSIPAERLSPDGQNRLRVLMARLLEHPDPAVRLATLTRLTTLPLSDKPRLLLPRLLDLLGSRYPDECRAAANAVFQTYTKSDASQVGQAIRQITSDRRALKTALEALQTALYANRVRLLPTLEVVLDALETDPLTVRWRVLLAIVGLPTMEMAALLERFAKTGLLHADALATAVQAVEGWRDRGDTTVVEPLQRLEGMLAPSPYPALRRIAVAALVAQSGKTPGWTTDLCDRLERYRVDPDPLVAEAAQFTLSPPDDAQVSKA